MESTAFPGSFALHKVVELADVLLFCSPRPGFSRSFCAPIVRSEANRAASPRTVRKHSKEELIAFFSGIQTSIADSTPKASRRTRKRSPDPFEEVEKRKQSYGDGGTDDVSEEHGKVVNLDDMKVAELRELARARRMRGYSKLKKGELIDRLKGLM
ncbi:uncharacterized protein LOC133930291 [Phragmites australis]|uniref:uncharacterized protein LOC133930291 n=1 Tax=Phragmites australis TaxID=29695 RepID=UPI002D7A25F4|nr:uncharacterized protein LOC133930291 [Phragmites australis]